MQLQEWTMEEQEQLIHFMTTNTWPFHGNSHPGRDLIEKAIEEGGYESDEVKTFWVENEESEKVGIRKIYDLQDEIPLFDLRIADQCSRKGIWSKCIEKTVAEYVFELPEAKIRLEGHTRQDNFAMRKTFERAGFVKEAHLRKAWFSPKENSYYDAVTYGITREDFLKGTTTPVKWDDDGHQKPVVAGELVFAEEFQTERLIIRAPKLEDAEVLWQSVMNSHDALKEWMPWARDKQTLEQTTINLRQAIADFMTRKDLRLHMFLKETGEFVGSSGLHRIDWDVRKFEIGYWIDSKFEGKGLMTEAYVAITDFAFKDLKANRVEVRCDSENVRSRSVAERAGFSVEGILRNDALSADGKTLRDTCIYALVSK